MGRNAFCVSGNEEFFPLRKGAWGKPRGVFPKRFWKTKFYKNARFRRLDAGEIARERENPQGIFRVIEQVKMRVQPRDFSGSMPEKSPRAAQSGSDEEAEISTISQTLNKKTRGINSEFLR
ncbi:MAG: hypothetical protein MSR67_09490 [Oscillospiraceae bacterium]|nr:hypothetical protein [Oscillospiraceae bacterium]